MKRCEILPADIPLDSVKKVTFYKVDEIATDLICCEIAFDDRTIVYHEELGQWDALIARLQTLPGFRCDWFSSVSQPPFATSETVAFDRSEIFER